MNDQLQGLVGLYRKVGGGPEKEEGWHDDGRGWSEECHRKCALEGESGAVCSTDWQEKRLWAEGGVRVITVVSYWYFWCRMWGLV